MFEKNGGWYLESTLYTSQHPVNQLAKIGAFSFLFILAEPVLNPSGQVTLSFPLP